MIPRYTRPPMGRVWSDEHRMQLWLAVEIAVCEAWAEEGVIPEADMAVIRGAVIQAERSDELFKQTHHDMIAFTRAIAESVGVSSAFRSSGSNSRSAIARSRERRASKLSFITVKPAAAACPP